jgi:ABC-type antimicrobial peptide transport system permease subunit
MNITIEVHLQWSTIVLGLFTGLIVPLISNIYPIKQALGNSLRNSLDRSRAGVDEISVQF